MNSNTQLNNIESKLNTLIELLGTPKQWLNTSELSHYLGYSKESIHKMVKSGEFKQGHHYHKKIKRLLFNKTQIDNWVQSDTNKNVNNTNYDVDSVINDILKSVA